MKGLRRHARGQIILLVSISMIALIGFAALAVDIGYMYSTRRNMQTAADAAAIAGANTLQTTNSGNYAQAAADVATLNGFTNGQNGVSVTAGAPTSGPYSGNANYVQVNVSEAVPTYFLRVLGYNTLNVAVSAVAGTVSGTGCIYALDPSASGAISLSGNINITASCGIIDNSSSSSALTGNGNGTVNTSYTGVAGNYSKSSSFNFTPTPKISIAPASDPLGGITAPTGYTSNATYTQLSTTNSGNYPVSGNNQTVTVPPSIYGGGISIAGNNTVVTFSSANYGNGITVSGNVSSATFNSGTYQNGGSGNSISISANATTTFNANGNYVFAGRLTLSGNNTVTLSPGTYYGGISISGNATVTFNPGTYILAGGGLSVTGNSTLTGTGVTFYNSYSKNYAYQPINLAGNETANLSAPTSGSLAGMLFFQDRSIPSGSGTSTIVGNSSSTFDGAIYFPTTSVSYVGNSSGSGYTFLIADTISMNGNASMTLGTDYSSLADGSPIKSSTLFQ
jgi:Flp pilus assembly protein TadG